VLLLVFANRNKTVSASVAMEHMIPDLLISEKVNTYMQICSYLLSIRRLFSYVSWFCFDYSVLIYRYFVIWLDVSVMCLYCTNILTNLHLDMACMHSYNAFSNIFSFDNFFGLS